MKFFVIIASVAVLAAVTLAAPNVYDNKIESDSAGTLSRAAKFLGSCFESDDTVTCLAVKGVTALNRAARSNNIVITNGITFTRNPSTERSAKAISENEVISELPQNSAERNGRLMDMAMESAVEFFDTHNLEIKVPTETTQEVARALDEGRGKIKKLFGPFALAIGAKLFAIVPILLGGLALLTTKAIVIAKIALFLALAVGATRLFGGGANKFGGGLGGGALGGGYNANTVGWTQAGAGQGWSAGTAAAGYPYARSINNNDEDAQKLAYSGQIH